MRRLLKTFFAFALLGSLCINVYAADVSDLEEKKKDVENKKEEVQSIVDELTAQQDNILSTIRELDELVTEFNNQIAELEERKSGLLVDIDNTKAELSEAKALEKKQYDAMKLRIQYSYENGDARYMDTFFTKTDITDIVNDSEYTEQVYNYDLNMLKKLISIKKTVANKQVELESELDTVEELETDIVDNKDAVEILIEGKQKQVESYSKSIEEKEEVLKEYEADLASIDAQIDEALEEYERRHRQNTGSELPITWTGGSFQWPVAGNYFYISSHFGPRDLAGTSYHHGLDIPCPTGTPILAGEAGVVILATYNSSLGNYVCIDHGGGVTTTYGHNSSLAVSAGQQVKRGDIIAYAGNTGFSFGSHCHFAVRINGSYVDPYPYLY